MRLKFIGPSTVEDLFQNGFVKNILDLFTLKEKKKEIKSLERFGDLKINKIIKAIEGIETTEANLLGAIGIKGIRAKRAKVVLDIYNIKELLKICGEPDIAISKISAIRGLGRTFAVSLVRGVIANRNTILRLLDLVKIKKSSIGGDTNIVFTGFRDPDLVKNLEDVGIEVSDGVNKKTILIVAKDPNGSSTKLKKAREMGIPIVDVAKAYDMFKAKN